MDLNVSDDDIPSEHWQRPAILGTQGWCILSQHRALFLRVPSALQQQLHHTLFAQVRGQSVDLNGGVGGVGP
jgi:RES domain-containing protein